jgi:hypothetical protein
MLNLSFLRIGLQPPIPSLFRRGRRLLRVGVTNILHFRVIVLVPEAVQKMRG